MTVANPEVFNVMLLNALGLRASEHVLSVTITATSKKWPTVTVERLVSVSDVGEIETLLQHYELVPKTEVE